jgi:hypothetical protein
VGLKGLIASLHRSGYTARTLEALLAKSEGGGAIKIVIAVVVIFVLLCGGCSLLSVLGVVAQSVFVSSQISTDL